MSVPIEFDVPIKVISQDEFHAIDREVMRQAFDVQNELGRFFDEDIYQNELVFRLRNCGMEAVSEGLITVRYQDFVKRYYVDMFVGEGALYELRAVDVLAGLHEKQVLHYFFLLGLRHGKLINFSSASVEHRFVSTRLTPETRHAFTLDDRLFKSMTAEDRLIREILPTLLLDWGAFLEVSLYEEALVHFLGGASRRMQPLNVSIGSRVLGTGQACLLQEDTALHISAIGKNHSNYRKYLERLFNHTCLRRIQWVNFNQSQIEIIALEK